MSDKTPGITRQNVMKTGVDLKALVGEKFTVQAVQFLGVEECRLCYWMDEALGRGAEAALKNRGALRARMFTSGRLRWMCELCAIREHLVVRIEAENVIR
jgi:hypothetical protein